MAKTPSLNATTRAGPRLAGSGRGRPAPARAAQDMITKVPRRYIASFPTC